MNALTRLTITMLGITIVLAACGSASHRASAPSVATSTATAKPLAHSVLPEPTGAFAIGVRNVASVAPAAATRVWYPARPGTGSGAPVYLPTKIAAAYGIPEEDVQGAVLRASTNAEPVVTSAARPAVVLMPGWGLPMAVSSALAQELASNGYVVVSVDPNHGTEDGNTMPTDPANPGRRKQQLAAALTFVTGQRIATIAGPVDANKIAVGGHSIAGAMAFQTALTDQRVHAVFDLDGWLHGPALTTPMRVPALMINASGLEPATRAIVAQTPSTVMVKLAGATHTDVTDVPCLLPTAAARKKLGLGTIGRVGTTTTNAVVLRFLDAVLRDGKAKPSVASLTNGLAGIDASSITQ
jgi:dienelactone hydrolase